MDGGSMTEGKVLKLLDILESQMLSFAAQASAAADIAGMLKIELSGVAQGVDGKGPLSQKDLQALLNEEVVDVESDAPRTFGDGRGARRKPTTEE